MTSVHPRVVSLWDMLKQFHGEMILRAMSLLASGHKRHKSQYLDLVKKNQPGLGVVINKDEIDLTALQVSILRNAAREYGLHGVDAASERVLVTLQNFPQTAPYSADLVGMLVSAIEILINTLPDAMRGQSIYLLTSNSASYLQTCQEPFGDAVASSFPSANYDISEAAKCLAFERWTAAVTHLMRALDPALRAFQSDVGVAVPKENWQDIINQVEAKLKKDGHKAAPNHQWNMEAVTHFRVLKDAWRNWAMHGRDRYDEERAVTIHDSVRSFMRHLATRLAE